MYTNMATENKDKLPASLVRNIRIRAHKRTTDISYNILRGSAHLQMGR